MAWRLRPTWKRVRLRSVAPRTRTLNSESDGIALWPQNSHRNQPSIRSVIARNFVVDSAIRTADDRPGAVWHHRVQERRFRRALSARRMRIAGFRMISLIDSVARVSFTK